MVVQNRDKELRELETEIKILNKMVETSQFNISESLVNGSMGKDIKKTLGNLRNPSKFELLRCRLNNFINSIFKIL